MSSFSSSSASSKPRYHGDITIEMIDDYLNPFLNRKKEKFSKVKFVPGPTTSGQGLPMDSGSKNIVQKTRANDVNNFDYVIQNKRQYEREIKEERHAFANRTFEKEPEFAQLHDTSAASHSGTRSVVGSGMSQIESVTTMNMSMSRKQAMMKHAVGLTKMRHDEEADCMGDENNNFGMVDMQKQIEEARHMYETDKEVYKQKKLDELCETFDFKTKIDVKLPITEKRDRLLNFLDCYPYSIIQGSTGCGKTTQVPQYILEEHTQKKKYCNIIVTQPRRIAAISVAKRVCHERGWRLGGLCGYQIGRDREHVSEDTRITYCTTGVLLEKLIGPLAQENFNKYTHIILDEVHERDLQTDFVLLILKIQSLRCAASESSKVILMSATIDCDMFRKYFAQEHSVLKASKVSRKAPVFLIENKPYNVQEFYWDDLVAPNSFMAPIIYKSYNETKQSYISKDSNKNSVYQRQYGYQYRSRYNRSYESAATTIKDLSNRNANLTTYTRQLTQLAFDHDTPDIQEETMQMVINLLKYFDEIERGEIEQQQDMHSTTRTTDLDETLESSVIDSKDSSNKFIDGFAEKRESVLIFVPGMQQIHAISDMIKRELPDRKLTVLPLHSDIVIEQQVRVFEKPQPTWRKVIISTSIAESSITVPDVKYVIDFGLTKELYCDPSTNYTHLRLEWASKSSMNQRRGRAGRCGDGICYRLISRQFFDEQEEFAKPAILREPLSSVILNVKRLQQTGEPKRILSMAIQPPKLNDIERTVLLLKEVGALTLDTRSRDGTFKNNPHDGNITYVGSVMANLPIDVRFSKLILLGHAFGKIREAIIIAAGLSTKTIFTCYFKSYLESFKAKWTWSEGWMCDSICILNVYNVWETMNENGAFSDKKAMLNWAKKNMIELHRLREVEQLKTELESRLESFGIKCNRRVKLSDRRGIFKPDVDNGAPYNIDDENDSVRHNLIIKMIIAGAFYPNYFNANPIDLQEAEKQVSLKDLKNTVQIKNLPNNEGVLYRKKLHEIFSACSNSLLLHFEDTKAYIEFKNQYSEGVGNVNLGVYLAVQMRLLNLPMQLKRFSIEAAQDKLRKYENLKKAVPEMKIVPAKTNTGLVKLNLNETLQSETSESEDDTLSYKSFNEDDSNHMNFVLSQRQNTAHEIDTSQYMSCASILDKQEKIDNEIHSLNNSMLNSTMTSIRSTRSIKLTTDQITPGLNTIKDYLSNPRYLLPAKVDQGQCLDVYVSEIIECGLFWCNIQDKAHLDTLNTIQLIMNGPWESSTSSRHEKKYALKALISHSIQVDTLCVTKYLDQSTGETQLYRANIINVNKSRGFCEVIFVDFGNKEKKLFSELYEMNNELKQYPFQAFKCKLANIKICPFKNPTGTWSAAATKKFGSIINKYQTSQTNSTLKLKIHNLDEAKVAHGTLIAVNNSNEFLDDNDNVDIGKQMVDHEYAEQVDMNATSTKSNNRGQSNILYIPSRKDGYSRTKPHFASDNNHYLKMSYKRSLNSNLVTEEDNMSTIESVTTESQYTGYLDELHEDENSYSGFIDLKGPYSPLEVRYFSITSSGHNKRTRVERNSINYANLDDDPYNDCDRLMVSAQVTLNDKGDSIIMRQTTLMPKFQGLSSICALLFAPLCELRTDERKTRFTGALCGLGSDSMGSIYPDNDIEIGFDVDIDVKDIMMINALRLAVNLIIGNEEAVSNWSNNEVNLRTLQQKACDKLLQVIQRNRSKIEATYFEHPYIWNMVDEAELISLNNGKVVDTKKEYYTYHKGIALVNSNR